jgi:hypothetical protein
MKLPYLFAYRMMLVLGVALTASAQRSDTKRPPAALPKLGSVSGRVFGITENGDLKPARLAHIYLLYKGSETTQEFEENTAGTAFARAAVSSQIKALTEIRTMRKEFAQKYPEAEFDENLSCRRELEARVEAVKETIDWVQQEKKFKQSLSTDADEEGLFQITKVPAGNYSLIALGQAGANDAFWSGEATVKSGSVVSVKLPSPVESCAVVAISP